MWNRHSVPTEGSSTLKSPLCASGGHWEFSMTTAEITNSACSYQLTVSHAAAERSRFLVWFTSQIGQFQWISIRSGAMTLSPVAKTNAILIGRALSPMNSLTTGICLGMLAMWTDLHEFLSLAQLAIVRAFKSHRSGCRFRTEWLRMEISLHKTMTRTMPTFILATWISPLSVDGTETRLTKHNHSFNNDHYVWIQWMFELLAARNFSQNERNSLSQVWFGWCAILAPDESLRSSWFGPPLLTLILLLKITIPDDRLWIGHFDRKGDVLKCLSFLNRRLTFWDSLPATMLLSPELIDGLDLSWIDWSPSSLLNCQLLVVELWPVRKIGEMASSFVGHLWSRGRSRCFAARFAALILSMISLFDKTREFQGCVSGKLFGVLMLPSASWRFERMMGVGVTQYLGRSGVRSPLLLSISSSNSRCFYSSIRS